MGAIIQPDKNKPTVVVGMVPVLEIGGEEYLAEYLTPNTYDYEYVLFWMQ